MSKKEWLLTALMCLLVAGASVAYVKWPRTVPFEQCSEVYQRYANHPGIQASFIKDKYINDSISIPITLLQATDSAAWQLLMKDFKIPVLPPEYEETIPEKAVSTRLFPQNHPERIKDTILLKNDFLVCYRKKHFICICHIDSEKQFPVLLRQEIHATKYNTNRLIDYEKKDDHHGTLRSAGNPGSQLPERNH